MQTCGFFPDTTYDGYGNISEYLDGYGDPVAHFEYDPFGNLTVDSFNNAADFPYRFSTKPMDPHTGLLYYGRRWYDPPTGRWPSRDPIGEMGGINLYVLVGNDAVNGIDFLGMREIEVKKCQAYLFIGHATKGSIKWTRESTCSIMGAVSCYPKSQQPRDTRHPDQKAKETVPSPVWPNLPDHDNRILTGEVITPDRAKDFNRIEALDRSAVHNGAVDEDDPSVEHYGPRAIDNAISDDSVNQIMKGLCKKCCQQVTFIVEVGDDKWREKVIENSVKNKTIDGHKLKFDDHIKFTKDCP